MSIRTDSCPRYHPYSQAEEAHLLAHELCFPSSGVAAEQEGEEEGSGDWLRMLYTTRLLCFQDSSLAPQEQQCALLHNFASLEVRTCLSVRVRSRIRACILCTHPPTHPRVYNTNHRRAGWAGARWCSLLRRRWRTPTSRTPRSRTAWPSRSTRPTPSTRGPWLAFPAR